jgi:hypothetical protein
VIYRPNNLQTPATGNQSVQRTQATQDPQQPDRRCYNCGEQGHYANRCPNPCTRVNQPTIATPTPPVETTLFLLLPSITTHVGESQVVSREGEVPVADFLWYSAAKPCNRNCFDRAEVARVLNDARRRPEALPKVYCFLLLTQCFF